MNLLYFILSLLLYIFAPLKYNLLFCSGVTVLFLLQAIPFITKKSKGNYVNFHTLFFFSFFFTNFFYPSVLYPIDAEFFSVFTYPFNHDYINKGTALAQLSASSFILGANSIKIKQKTIDEATPLNIYIDHRVATLFTILLFTVFILTVGSDFLLGNFRSMSTLSIYILQLLTCSFILSPVLFFRNFELQKQKKLFYLTAAGYIFLFLFVGDRGPALFLLILLIGLYTFYVKKIALKYLLIFGIAGVVGMHLIGLGRTADISSTEGNIISRGIERTRTDDQFQSYYAVTQSFVVNTRNLYVGLEYVDNKGINWGKTHLPSILGVIPFAQSAIENLSDNELEGSAGFFTELAFGKNPPYGLGTNLVADVFISFGLLGCIILFYLFGRLVEYYRKKIIITGSIYSNIIYFTLLSYSVYYPRTGLFMPLKFIIWTFVIYIFLLQFKLLKTKTKLPPQ